MSTGNSGVGANDAELHVSGGPAAAAPERSPREVLADHNADHPGVNGTFTPDCAACLRDAAAAHHGELREALEKAKGKAEKLDAFLVAAHDEVSRLHLAVAEAAGALNAAEEHLREVGDNGMVRE